MFEEDPREPLLSLILFEGTNEEIQAWFEASLHPRQLRQFKYLRSDPFSAFILDVYGVPMSVAEATKEVNRVGPWRKYPKEEDVLKTAIGPYLYC